VSTAISASDTLRVSSDPVWARLHQHPFILELAAGTLPLEKFRYFLEQDVFYLEEYARCLAMGAAKSRTADELRYFVADLNNVLDAEIPSNLSLLDKVIGHGAADRGGADGPAPANVAYTSYLHALSMRGGPLDIMAALLPCAWSYVEIATALLDRTDTTHPVYSEWIGYFSRPQTLEVVSNMRHDFDALALEVATSDARRRDIADAFTTSSRLELGFWEMAYTFERWPDAAT
jgi:thiaminase (transcriptional activator TenA)